jgi:hypothetical protein
MTGEAQGYLRWCLSLVVASAVSFLIGYVSGLTQSYDNSYHRRMKTRYDQSEASESK